MNRAERDKMIHLEEKLRHAKSQYKIQFTMFNEVFDYFDENHPDLMAEFFEKAGWARKR